MLTTGAPAQDDLEKTARRLKRDEAEHVVADLHYQLAKFGPDKYLWQLQTNRDHIDFDGEPDTLRLAWDRNYLALLDKGLYGAVLQLIGASKQERQRIWQMYNRAAQLLEAAKEPPTSSPEDRRAKLREVTKSLSRTTRFTMTELALVDTEPAFMAHLGVLKDRAGGGLRPLAKAMQKRDPKVALSSSSLGDLFNRDRIPTGEKFVRLLVEVLLENIEDVDDTDKVVEEHLRVWRMLILRRHQEGLQTSPLRLALTRLAEAQVAALRNRRGLSSVAGLQAAREIILDAVEELRHADAPARAADVPMIDLVGADCTDKAAG